MIYNRIENTKRNIVFGLINKVILMICPFIVRTIIIHKLGLDYVGLNSLFSSILQVLSLAELGFGTAVVYSMYKPIADGDTELICALQRFYRNVYKIIGFITLAVGLLIIPFLPRLISGDYPAAINIYVLYIIYLLNTVSSYLLFAYKQSLLTAHQRNDVENNISTIVYVVMYILQIVVLLCSSNYYYYAILLPLATIVLNVVRQKVVCKLYPTYICKGDLPKAIKRDMYKRVFGLMLTRICQVTRNSLDSIVISSFLGLVLLGQYQNYYFIMSTVISFLQIITTSIVAAIGNSVATRSVKENYLEFKLFHFGYNWIATWCTVCLMCLYQPFMTIWVGEENLLPNYIVIIMAIYFYSLKTGDVISLYKEATGIYWEDKYRPIVESIANIVLNLLLVQHFGVAGVAIATIITIVFINIPWSTSILFRVYFKQSTKEFYFTLAKYIAEVIAIAGVTYFVCNLITIDGIVGLVVIALVCICIPNVIFIGLNCKNHKLKQFVSIAKKMVSR